MYLLLFFIWSLHWLGKPLVSWNVYVYVILLLLISIWDYPFPPDIAFSRFHKQISNTKYKLSVSSNFFYICLRHYSSLLSIVMTNHWSKLTWKGKSLFHFVLLDYNPPSEGDKAGTPGRNLKSGTVAIFLWSASSQIMTLIITKACSYLRLAPK